MKVGFDRPIAHRGLHDRARGIIENSLTAFEAAIGAGYAIECDVQLSRDGVPIIFHDDELTRLTGEEGRIGDRPAAELAALPLLGSAAGETPPTLAAMLALVQGRALLQVELKRQPTAAATRMLAEAVAREVRAYGGPLVLESFDSALLVALRRAGVGVPLGIITYGYDEPEWDGALSPLRRFALRHLLHWPMTRFAFISCRDRALALPAVRLGRHLGLPVTAWTIRSPGAAAAALAQADQIVFEGFLPGTGARR